MSYCSSGVQNFQATGQAIITQGEDGQDFYMIKWFVRRYFYTDCCLCLQKIDREDSKGKTWGRDIGIWLDPPTLHNRFSLGNWKVPFFFPGHDLMVAVDMVAD